MIGIIGGSGVYNITDDGIDIENKTVQTPFGSVEIATFNLKGKNVAFIPRHGSDHSNSPHKVNYRANICGLKCIGVEEIIATNAVGSINLELPPGAIVLPDDFIDFTSRRESTFWDNHVRHVDFSEPYCNRLRKVIASTNKNICTTGNYICVEGPRFETPGEIRMFQKIGGDLVGMTGLPEAVLAREIEMCYSSICLVSNFGTSISPTKLTMDEVLEIAEEKNNEILQIINDTIKAFPEKEDCSCKHALDGSGA
ncbi:MAG: S-methyl-5'-thioadenosine phosphorylase [Methanobacteriaceae archaeon]